MSSLFSSKGSLSWPSLLSRSPLMKVPLLLFTSLMNIYILVNQHAVRRM